MAARQKKLEKHRRRRQEKQRQTRVAQNHRIADYLSDRHEVHACYANAEWKEEGMASILLARRISSGTVSYAAFLVDALGMGLKDASCETEMPLSEFEEHVERMRSRVGAESMKLATAQHLVYGGIEVARKLNLRLPKQYERATRILGALPPGVQPDMSLFGQDGKLHIFCNAHDLERRYLGDPRKLEERDDVVLEIAHGDDFTLAEDEDDDPMAAGGDEVAEVTRELIELTYAWCELEGVEPSPLIHHVIRIVVGESGKAMNEKVSQTNAQGEISVNPEFSEAMIDRIITQLCVAGFHVEEVTAAFEQVMGAMGQEFGDEQD